MTCSVALSTLLAGLTSGVSAFQPWSTWGHERIQLADTSIHFRYSEGGKPPLLLVHGSPQHSPSWATIGPILAEQYTVIAPDNRGQGESALSISDNYTAPAAASDLKAILNFLNVNSTLVLAHDKGAGLAAALALENPGLVEKMILAEYALPGFGYATTVNSPQAYQDWQLAFFAVPDIAASFVTGKEREMLSWYFYHGSYSGNDVISNDALDIYTRALAKPGFLRAMFQYFASAFFEAEYFPRKVNETGKIETPTLVLGGEASISPVEVQQQLFEPVLSNGEYAVVPKAGHWIADENPSWVANKALEFFADSNVTAPLELAWLENTITMFGNFGLGQLTPGINGTS